MMKVTLLKKKGKKETINRITLDETVHIIREGDYIDLVHDLRGVYNYVHPRRMADGRMETAIRYNTQLPHLCFSTELVHKGNTQQQRAYNGLVVLEANNLESYGEAVRLRNEAGRMPQTLMTFLGASGRSVKIVCRGELFADERTDGQPLPTEAADADRFHRRLYATARKAYNAQLDITLDALEPLLTRTIFITVDPDIVYQPHAVPFYVSISEESNGNMPDITQQSFQLQHILMPGRSVERSYHLNYQFIITQVLGRYFELPDEQRVAELLMQVATRCLQEDIPQAIAVRLTMLHPVLNTDKLLVEKTFEGIYAVKETAAYYKRNKVKPLRSVPEDTLLMMKTDIFLNTHYEMRKNVMTGVAQYREKNGEFGDFQDLDEEARNEMTIRAKEMGLKSWDRDIERFIDSPRIEKYDPVNTWLEQLPQWDGRDRIGELAARVPTNQPHWEHYLHIWLLGMVAHWQGKKALTGNALVPLLIGRQGCGKSSFCRILLPHALRDYYNDRINFRNETDLNLGLTSFALINIDEFDKTTQRQQVLLKYLLSTADVKFRPPYGKAYKQYRRYASFIGTTNQLKPLTDPTGSRRFVCVEVTDLISFSDDVNHDQLYAQLKQEISDGERYWLTDEEITTLISENERFQRIDSLAEMIANLFSKPENSSEGQWYSATEILEILQQRYGKTALSSYSPEKIGNTLSSRQFDFYSEHKKRGTCYRMVRHT